ncbi:MAG: PBP1A family penicillin-binding protein [Anaerolineae bacterium]|nr:PBP1A family penicillin-binding protein [Anaerolineae bacterium]
MSNQPSSPKPQPPRQPRRPLPPPPPGYGQPAGSVQTPRSRRQASGSGCANGVLMGVFLFLIVALLGLALFALGYAGIATVLPPASELITRASQGENTRILDRNGALLQAPLAPNDPAAGLRRHVALDDISPYLVAATIATEDANFYNHPGVDPAGLARAIFRAVQNSGPVVGTSTISQQLVKLVFLSPERTVSRKIKEAVLAAEITRRYDKDTILELYLNQINYGNLAYGAGSAARLYFNKPAAELTLAEAALLAGLPQAPATYDPLQNPEAAKDRQADVLRLMVENGAISAAEADAAWAEPLTYHGQGLDDVQLSRAPHFVTYVRSQLEQLYGPGLLYNGGLQVYTSLDSAMQQQAEQLVSQGVAELSGQNVSNGALVAIDPRTGEIKALVGSADFFDAEISGQVNVAISPRQPGSTIKPFTYLATFERAEDWWTPATLIDDVRTEFDDGPGRPPYVPTNYDGKEHGRVSVRTALANSYNVPAVKALRSVGVDALLQVTDRFGMATLTQPGHPLYGLSLTLGGGEVTLLEMTSAYGALANGGVLAAPTTILCVLDAQGNVLERLETSDLPAACRDAPVTPDSLIQQPRQQRAALAQHAYLLTHILKDNEARSPTFGANSSLVLDRPAAVKTGTTNDVRDIWTIGYTPQLVTGVWVGNADGTPMNPRLSGIAGAGPIWNRFMRAALAEQPKLDFAVPDGIQQVEICTTTGAAADASCPSDQRRMEVFAADQLPPGAAPGVTPVATAASANVAIYQPYDGQILAGLVRIVGSATAPDFDHYLVEYGESFSPGAWGIVAGPVYNPVENGDLAWWDTARLPVDGPHLLRVVAVDRSGRRYESMPARVTVARPTASPTATALDTATPKPTATPVVLPSATPTATWLPSPTSTATPVAEPTTTPTVLVEPPTATPPLPNLIAVITQPADGNLISGLVSISGVAAGPDFASYTLQYSGPEGFLPVRPDQPVYFTPSFDALGTWNTTGLPSGAYSLLLTVRGVSGAETSTTVSVTVQN